jgi:hypothetical protein
MRPVHSLRIARLLALLGLVGSLLAAPATVSAAGCGPFVEFCSDTINTPLGTANVSVDTANVVTVDFIPPNPIRPFVTALPLSISPNLVLSLGFTRFSLPTRAGTVNIDTRVIPPNPILGQFSGLVVISIIPTDPCRVSVTRTLTDTIVVFTPIR